MKTKLTLKTGAFYFLSTANLARNVEVLVDLSTLSQAELDSIKAYIAVGHITSSEDISSYTIKNETPQDAKEEVQVEDFAKETVEEKAEEVEETETPVVEAEKVETEEKEAYTEMTVKELRAEITKRNLQTKATHKDDLVQVLEDDDSSKK